MIHGVLNVLYADRTLNRKLNAACFMLASFCAYFSTLKKEMICSTETAANFHRITRC